MALRILTVSHFFEDHGGGIERVAGNLSREFVKMGVITTWAAAAGNVLPECPIRAVPLECVNPIEKLTGLPMPVPGPRGMHKLVSEVRRSDAVIIHDALYVTSIFAMVFGKVLRKRIVLIQHIGEIAFSSRILRFFLKAANLLVTRPMLRAADARVFISDPVRRELLGDSSRSSSELLFNGVDKRTFHPAARSAIKRDSLAELAIEGDRCVLFVGRYVEKKGMAVLRALAESRPNLDFLMAGNGPIRPADWGLANVCDLGPQSAEAIADLYRAAEVLLLPSVGEGYPLVIQEAMACGLPVICGSPSDRADPGAARWLRGVEIDLTRPEESARRCSDAIDAISLSTGERQAMADYASSQYDWRVMAQRLTALARPPAAVE